LGKTCKRGIEEEGKNMKKRKKKERKGENEVKGK
jgi:hypothetical protein